MIVFDPKTCEKKPRADMFLPDTLNVFGIVLDVFAIAALVASLVLQMWWLLLIFLGLGALGIAAYLCWKNQKINIVDENSFEYTTFLGKKTLYYFSEIKGLRTNQDSLTLFVGGR